MFEPPEAYSKPPLAYPHPVITEVLYAVPTKAGDANHDGKRDTAGDEFVELINPHDRVINLHGYSLRDSGEGKSQFKFTFPAIDVQPGQVVVVFNGNDSKIPGPVGTSKGAPAEGNPSFHNALVFDARMTSSRASWANKSDYVLLCAPNGSPLECITWGGEKKPPSGTLVIEEAPAVMRGSVQRERITDPAIRSEPSAATPAKPADAGPPSSVNPVPSSPATPKDPKSPKPGDQKPPRPTYQRKREAPAPDSSSPSEGRVRQRPLTFAPFTAHPSVPQFLVGTVPDAPDGEDGILFSPGLYPLDAGIEPASGSSPGSAPAHKAGDGSAGNDRGGEKPKQTPGRNTGDPR